MAFLRLSSRVLNFFKFKTELVVRDETIEEQDGQDNGSYQINPFILPPVLEVLFEYLPLKDLAKWRLVNKTWYNASLSALRSNATLKFEREGLVSTLDDGSRSTTSLREFCDLWSGAGQWASRPFKKFKLYSWKFEAEDEEQKRFVELVGGHVISLTLVECSFVGRDHFRKIIYQDLTKLRFLKMDKCKVDDAYWDASEEIFVYEEPAFKVHELEYLHISGGVPHSMMDLLSHFHKVMSLHAEAKEQSYPHWSLLEIIRVIRAEDQTKLPLKDFAVNFIFELGEHTDSSIARLQFQDELNLPLQHLQFQLCSFDDDLYNLNLITDILQCYSSTLTHLTFAGYVQPGLFNAFPFGFHLEKLEKLDIRAPGFSDNLNFLKYTPNLRALKILESLSMAESNNLFSNSEQLEIGDWTLPSLTDLNIYLKLSPSNLRKLSKWMPNVEELFVKLDDAKFSVVCNNWKNIKKITDPGTKLTDKGVLKGLCGSPNITKLGNLTSFWTYSSKLTSASVLGGFLKLANLKLLMLKSTKLDDNAKAALKSQKIRFYRV